MKNLLYFFPISFILIFSACETNYTYLENPEGTLSGDIAGLTCMAGSERPIELVLTVNSKFYVYEIANKGDCTAEVKVEFLNPAARQLSLQTLESGKRQVFIEDIPKPKAGDKLRFTLKCRPAETGECKINFNARVCDKTREQDPPNQTFTINPTGRKTIAAPAGTANPCLTPEGNKLELLTLKNESKTPHDVIYKIKSNCDCPEFHVDPPNNFAAPNTELNSRFRIPANSTVTFKAFCGGVPINDTCEGEITQMIMQPKK